MSNRDASQHLREYLVRLFFAILLAVFWVDAAGISFASGEAPCGKIVSFRGQVNIYEGVSRTWHPARLNHPLRAGDVIQTGPSGWAAVLLADETTLQLNRNSRFLLKKVAIKAGWDKNRGVLPVGAGASRSEYGCDQGEVWVRNKNKEMGIRIDSPSVAATIRGTELNLKIEGDAQATLTVLEGRVQASNSLGVLEVAQREQVVARPGQPLVKTLLLSPEDTVQWTIALPFPFEAEEIPPDVRQALQLAREGRWSDSQRHLDDILNRRPREVSALQLSAMTSLVLGNREASVEAARKAIEAAPRNPSAWLVSSYIWQASFDLVRALDAAQKALSLDTSHVPALVQYAQLKFGMDDLDGARRAVEKAIRLAPDHGAVQNLSGFLYLAQSDTDGAITAFRKAVTTDPDNGEPHLGLALAYMRKGMVPEAFEEMSAAVLLEPRRALFVTYWGKMLYQIERHDKALDMLEVARTLDPLDPTPELYRAMILRDMNRPTEAVGAINRAIRLNDNRAVYRSRFLLDSDRAVKNVDQAMLFNQLGLLDWARSKATSSVKNDFSNSSAHLFLAGSLQGATDRYRAMQSEYSLDAADRSWAMQNEYLLARMLMPANTNSFNTFNDYTSFFERPSINATLTGSLGSDATAAVSAIPYGAVPAANLAFGAQLSHDKTDGWRGTNGERSGNLATLVKWDATPKDSLMGVFSHQSAKQYDRIYPRFDYDGPAAPGDWNENGVTRFELGYHRRISPDAHVLLYVARMKGDGTLYQVSPTARGFFVLPPRIDVTQDQIVDYRYELPYWQAQGQYLHRLGRHQIIVGINSHWGEMNGYRSTFTDTKYYLGGLLLLEQQQTSRNDHPGTLAMQSCYLVDTIRINDWLTAEGAFYLDRMTNGDATSGAAWTLNEFGPRLGLVLTPTRSDTFRVAAFRYLLPFISSRLDPTDVAGMAVLRNNQAGSVMSEAAASWEHEWTSGFFGTGAFYSEKSYDYGSLDSKGFRALSTAHGRLKGADVKLNQLLWKGVGLHATYRYQHAVDEALPSADREDHLVRAGLRFLHTCGLSARLTQTYRRIHLSSQDRANETVWITDTGLGYEFPGKKGFIGMEVRNLFNAHFNWTTDHFSTQGRWPSREVLFTLTLNL